MKHDFTVFDLSLPAHLGTYECAYARMHYMHDQCSSTMLLHFCTVICLARTHCSFIILARFILVKESYVC
jgi:hypothetical protein